MIPRLTGVLFALVRLGELNSAARARMHSIENIQGCTRMPETTLVDETRRENRFDLR